MTGIDEEGNVTRVRWGSREWMFSVVMTIVVSGGAGTSVWTSRTVSAKEAEQDGRIGVLEMRVIDDQSKINEMYPLLQRIDERTRTMQSDVRELRNGAK